jgi:hypothetical protein
MDFRTEKGNLGLGDKLSQIAKRYPGGKRSGAFLVYDDGNTRMSFFEGDRKNHRITAIVMSDASESAP